MRIRYAGQFSWRRFLGSVTLAGTAGLLGVHSRPLRALDSGTGGAMRVIRLLLLVGCWPCSALSQAAEALVLCANSAGVVFVGVQCAPGQTQLDPVALGLQGPKGDTGATGPTGPTGPAGTADAFFAHNDNAVSVNHDSFVQVVALHNLPAGNYALVGTATIHTDDTLGVLCALRAPGKGISNNELFLAFPTGAILQETLTVIGTVTLDAPADVDLACQSTFNPLIFAVSARLLAITVTTQTGGP